jgi:hypothetical protein
MRVVMPNGLTRRQQEMARDLLLWLLGVPLGVIVLLHLVGVLHW